MSAMNSLAKLSQATVVGISGVTCGGKSSLAKLLKSRFPRAALIHQDDYFLPNNSLLPRSLGGVDHANWDSIEAVDMVKLMDKVASTLKELSCQSKSLLIIDGFLIFNYPPLAELCHLKYFLTLPYEECWRRRQLRTYDPPDPPNYFQKCAWPMFLLNLERMQSASYAKSIAFLEGTTALDDNCQLIVKDIDLLMNAPSIFE